MPFRSLYMSKYPPKALYFNTVVQNISSKVDGCSPYQEISTLLAFIAMLRKVYHWTLSWTK
jgi:hypothetical protein